MTEYERREYIVLYECDGDTMFDMGTKERIVRCRDCKYFYEDRRCTSIGWVDVFVCDSEQWSTSSLIPSHKVEPDGFCAWAIRRDE